MGRLERILMLATLAGLAACSQPPPGKPGPADRIVSKRAANLERSTAWVSGQFEADVDSLARAWRRLLEGTARDADRTREAIAGFPQALEDNVASGSAAVSRDFDHWMRRMERDVEEFPRAVDRLFYLLW